ncbi:diguanylate cyclase [Methylobacterium sp. 4-46]|uniref:GGDEF domain-containing protein n=1 Tax=unclassified Methylobacterium TaxID=2615210 RepID=UPI000152BFB1|nr:MULTISPECIES: GGDEF domain-containing protein [Methylobacterium]ACA18675.1 diguanylate cyclase [Methylobacterium sp. 4-46]WFT77909.1 GGDEF domain-containing protein [Methylobacterium nodulans]
MSDVSRPDTDRSFAIGQRALELMKAYGSSACPRSYAVWYTYVSGQQPLLNEAVKRLTAEHGHLRDDAISILYDTYIDPRRHLIETERAGASLLGEMEQVLEMLDVALGSTARYGASLQAFSQDIVAPTVNRGRLRELVTSLIVATRDVSANNRTLEARMRESREEIQALHETLEAVRVESLTDPLTGLGNRKLFEQVLRKSVEEAAANAAPTALIILDIDHFKRFNDVYGHLTGDRVLRLVALTMREMVDGRATIARFGGEEFGVIMPCGSEGDAVALAERIRTSVMGRELVKRSSGESLGRVTISVGVATHRPGDTAVSLLERADQCMFAAKRSGRNRVVVDTAVPDLTQVA